MNPALSFPLPTSPLPPVPSVNPRPGLAPLSPLPNIPPNLPSLPTKARPLNFTPTHTLTTHLFPAAYPRYPSTPGQIKVPDVVTSPGDDLQARETRRRWIRETTKALIEEKRRLDVGVGGVEEKGKVLWGCVNRIARREKVEEGRRGVVLLLAHPIGFNKEIWETTVKRLIEITERHASSVRIDELWSVDAFNHGDAGIINESNLPKLTDRADHGRDLANLCIFYVPHRSYDSQPLPLHLPRVDDATANDRMNNGYKDRTLIGLGHSLGGDAIALFGYTYPAMFSACILVETTIFPIYAAGSYDRSFSLISSTLGRKSTWGSRHEARESIRKSTLFKAWHPDVLELYIEYGLIETSETGQVKLKCNPAVEAAEFTETRTNTETWELLPLFDPRVEIRWVQGGRRDAAMIVGGTDIVHRTVWRRETNTSNVKVPDAGHLIVQEKPFAAAEEVAKFLNDKFRGHHEAERLRL